MSQPRNRRPRTAGLPAAHSDYVTSQVQEDHNNKSTYKIPKSVRYDLENALLGLCDVWFEEIKPHLVRNNLKLHTGGALNDSGGSDLGSPAGDHQRGDQEDGQWRSPGAHLDPGAASDVRCRRRPATSSKVFSPTRLARSRAPSHRPPAECSPTPLSLNKFRNLLQVRDDDWTRPSVQTMPARRSLPISTPAYQQNLHNLPKQLVDGERAQLPVRREFTRQASPPLPPKYLQNVQRSSKRCEQRPAASSKVFSPTQLARSRLPYHLGQPEETSPTPLSPNKHRNTRVRYDEWTRPAVQKTSARRSSPILRPGYQQSIHNLPKQISCGCTQLTECERAWLPVRIESTRQASLPLTPSYHQNLYSLPNRLADNEWTSGPPVQRETTRLPSPPPMYHQNVHNSSKQNASSCRRKAETRRRSLSPRSPPKRITRCPSCSLLASLNRPVDILSFHRTDKLPPPWPHVASTQRPLSHTNNIQCDISNSPPFKTRDDSYRLSRYDTTCIGSLRPNFLDAGIPNRLLGILTLDPAAYTIPFSKHFASNSQTPPLFARISQSPPHLATNSRRKPRRTQRSFSLSPPQRPFTDEAWFRPRDSEEPTPLTRSHGRTRPPINENFPVYDIRKTPSKHPVTHERKVLFEDPSSLFTKDLIDLIGEKNDSRLRVLFRNPTQETSYQSTMCLAGSRKKRKKTTPKKKPWR